MLSRCVLRPALGCSSHTVISYFDRFSFQKERECHGWVKMSELNESPPSIKMQQNGKIWAVKFEQYKSSSNWRQNLSSKMFVAELNWQNLCNIKYVFYVGPPEERILLTTIYGLYFSHHYTYTVGSQGVDSSGSFTGLVTVGPTKIEWYQKDRIREQMSFSSNRSSGFRERVDLDRASKDRA